MPWPERSTAELTAIIHRDALRQAAAFVVRSFARLRNFHSRHRAMAKAQWRAESLIGKEEAASRFGA